MERKLFKDTHRGTPQGGIISPLLANVYLHELDRYMERYTGLSTKEKTMRRRQGLANYAYVRYADDFVVLCNGGKGQAVAMREDLCTFLAARLRLALSMEKTRVTHLNDGFDFLGFHLCRRMDQSGMCTKVLISDKGKERHLATLRAATSPSTHQDSVISKIQALNRIIAGWCRYYQYTSRANTEFAHLGYLAFRMVVNWLARKFRLSASETLRRYMADGKLGNEALSLLRHHDFHTQQYKKRFYKPNPYTALQPLIREELPDDGPWLGVDPTNRKGMADRRKMVIERDDFCCQLCGMHVGFDTAKVDHRTPVAHYKNPAAAHRPENLWTLCYRCHERKTESDRQMESRMR